MANPSLNIPMILRHGARIHANSIVDDFSGETLRSASFTDVAAMAGKLATSLRSLGVDVGDRVATLCWNHLPHLAAYLAVPSMGAVLHTLNCRLSAEQLAFIVEDAGDRILLADAMFAPLLTDVLSRTPCVEAVIFHGSPATPFDGRPCFDLDTLLAGASSAFEWRESEETAAAVACYTSGTTGLPKGVVYSHRSIFLHSLGSLGVDTFGIRQTDRIMLLPPMFHANAWGLPYSAWLGGADLILPGADLSSAAMRKIIEQRRPTFTAMVPTLLSDLLNEHRHDPIDMTSFRTLVSGGASVAAKLVRDVREAWNLDVIEGWGMTETGPVCALTIAPKNSDANGDGGTPRSTSGRPVPGTELRVVDDAGCRLPEDGNATGELQIRGIWATGRYHGDRSPETFTADGWIRTGDIGTIDPQGYARLTDRAKDIIKSGGEWISSVELEALLLDAGGIADVAIVAFPDKRWGERPLAIIVPEGENPQPGILRSYLKERVPRFWIPERWAYVPSLPRTSVGKVDKKLLRARALEGQFEFILEDG